MIFARRNGSPGLRGCRVAGIVISEMNRATGVLLSLALCAGTFANASNQLQIKTDTGKVEGSLTEDAKVRAFKGIPYAAPPVGNLRWQAPQPAAKWKGVRPAKEFGNHCVQTNPFPDMIFRDPGQSEDCLTLNVWTPISPAGQRLPVMVWMQDRLSVRSVRLPRRKNPEPDAPRLPRVFVVAYV